MDSFGGRRQETGAGIRSGKGTGTDCKWYFGHSCSVKVIGTYRDLAHPAFIGHLGLTSPTAHMSSAEECMFEAPISSLSVSFSEFCQFGAMPNHVVVTIVSGQIWIFLD